MAELTQQAFDEMKAALDAANAKIEQHEAQTAKQARQNADHLAKLASDLKGGGAVVIQPMYPIPGSFNAKWKNPIDGKERKRKVQFQDGQMNVRLQDGRLCHSEGLIKLANAKAGSKAADVLADMKVLRRRNELPLLLAYPEMASLTKEQAAARLTELAAMDYPLLK